MISPVQSLQTWILAACLLAASVAAAQQSENPVFQEQALSAGHFQVGMLGSAQMQLVTELEGVTFKARGLPKGLSCDAQTGIISGYPAKAGEAKVVLTAKLGKVSASRKVALTVLPFPELAVGEFQGLSEPHEHGWAPWGAAVHLKVTTGGLLTGKVIVDKRAYPLKGRMLCERDAVYEAALEVAQGVTLQMSYLEGHTAIYATLNEEGSDVETWVSAFPAVPRGSSELQRAKGTYNVLLSAPFRAGQECPKGDGFLVAKFAAGGRVNLKGRLGDGTAVTASSPLLAGEISSRHQVLMHVPLYERRQEGSRTKKSTGVFQGGLEVFVAPEGSFADNGLYPGSSYSLLWLKGAQPGGGDGLYAAGFEMALQGEGRLYRRPAGGKLLLNVQPGQFNGRLRASLDDDIPHLWLHSVTLTSGHKIIPASDLMNGVKKLNIKVNAATGLFSGSYIMDDPDFPKVVFAGAILTTLDTSRASGHLLLQDPSGELTGEPGVMKSYFLDIASQVPPVIGGGAPPSGGGGPGAGLGGPSPGGPFPDPDYPGQPTTGPFPFPEPMPVQPVWGDQGNQGNPGSSSGGTLPTLPSSGSLIIASGSSVSFGGSVNYGGSFNNGVSLINEGSLSFGSGSSTQLSGVPISWISWDGSTIYESPPPP
ncbi:Ig domain-containing protein [Prosthecobacter sp. SYSU 5D2]|uniref:Ig domain-containing protein n=1 Tax=Prosthecobacter sp. SYSU 5D2 TaxID=3134134 RepID=UPI0031FEDF7A